MIPGIERVRIQRFALRVVVDNFLHPAAVQVGAALAGIALRPHHHSVLRIIVGAVDHLAILPALLQKGIAVSVVHRIALRVLVLAGCHLSAGVVLVYQDGIPLVLRHGRHTLAIDKNDAGNLLLFSKLSLHRQLTGCFRAGPRRHAKRRCQNHCRNHSLHGVSHTPRCVMESNPQGRIFPPKEPYSPVFYHNQA